jgi:hypothetical protein
MTKMKRVELEAKPYLNHTKEEIVFKLTPVEYELMADLWGKVKSTFFLEIPLPEPSVSITPSELDKLSQDYLSEPKIIGYKEYLISKLFPGWE